MANSDKNILITPNTGSATLNPTIRFTGANNTPLTLRTLDTGTLSFEGTAGQLFSISDGLSGTIFSVNDISGIPSIEVLDTGLTKINQYNGQTVIGSSAALTSSSVAAMLSMVTRSATTPGLIVRGFTSQSANLQEWQSVTPSIVASVGPTGILTASSFIPTSSTVPVNGMYLSAANTLNLATNTTNRMSIDSSGVVTVPGNLISNINTTAKTSAYQLTTADANTVIQMNGAFAFQIDTSLAVLPLGTNITLVAQTAGVTIATTANSTVPTINATPGLKLRTAWSTATLIKMSASSASGTASTWLLTGDLTA
jgi:hypothetical protein